MATLAPSRQPPQPPTRFTVDQYHRMIEAEILGEDDAVELLDGYIVQKMPRNPRHDSTVTRLQRLILAIAGQGWSVRPQNAITLVESEPEPDVAIAIGADGRYDDHHPGPTELQLVVEVADSSLQRDREDKAPIYARSCIPIYWIVNLPERQIEVYTHPSGPNSAPSYRQRRDYQLTESVPVVLDGQAIGQLAVSDILPG